MATRKLATTVTSAYIMDILTLQSEMLRRLVREDSMELSEIGKILEEIGSLYLALSEAIRRSAADATTGAQRAYPLISDVWNATASLGKSRQD
jgi:hypothetical protein